MNLHDLVVETLRVLSDPLGLVNSKKQKNSSSGDYKMLSKSKLTKLFREPSKHANEIIQDQLERMEVLFNEHVENEDKYNALAIYQEYKEWIDAEDGESYGFILLEFIGETKS
jgi:hypothetical protein